MIDEGYAMDFAEGLALEGRVAREHAKEVSPETVAERRRGVMARGRDQSSGGT